MFYLVGIGLSPEQITQEALEALKSCDEVYLDAYTSAYAGGGVGDLEKMSGKHVVPLSRDGVEIGFAEKLGAAGGKNIALAVFGDALSATTHLQLLLDAKKQGIEFVVMHGVSVFDVVAECGLDRYRFGRTCTIVKPQAGYAPESFYDAIERNNGIGLHTLCLLDIPEKGGMLNIKEAVEILEGIEKNRGLLGDKSIMRNSVLVGIAGAGSMGQRFAHGGAEKIKKIDFKKFPQSLVVCGELSDKEKEALGEFA